MGRAKYYKAKELAQVAKMKTSNIDYSNSIADVSMIGRLPPVFDVIIIVYGLIKQLHHNHVERFWDKQKCFFVSVINISPQKLLPTYYIR